MTAPISTPPSTTLSTPSPTERSNPVESYHDLDDKEIMARPIYLIVATTVCKASAHGFGRLGIGNQGGLPWGMIKKDMGFFRDVTNETRPRRIGEMGRGESINAVVMGRKTYESIPAKFRPLAGRVNVVVSRRKEELVGEVVQGLKERGRLDVRTSNVRGGKAGGEESVLLVSTVKGEEHVRPEKIVAPVLVSSSVSDALAALAASRSAAEENMSETTTFEEGLGKELGNVFVIGGAEIYGSFLDHFHTSDSRKFGVIRILQTEVKKIDGNEFECDTFFPVSLGEEGSGWKKVRKEKVRTWLTTESEDVNSAVSLPQGDKEWARDEKAGVEIRVVGWEKEEVES